MINLLACCPAPTELNTIPAISCPNPFKQIVRVVLQREQPVTTPTFTEASVIVESTWTALMSVSDSTKVVITPFAKDGKTGVIGGKFTAGEHVTIGEGSDETVNGQTVVIDRNLSRFVINAYDVPAAVNLAIRQILECETNLTAYFITSDNKVIARKVSTTDVRGFRISGAGYKEISYEGFGTRRTNELSFNIEKNWDTAFELYQTTFALSL